MLDRALLAALLLLAACPLWSLPALTGEDPPANAMWVDSLDLGQMAQSWGQPHAGQSVEGNPICLAGTTYRHGLGTHADSRFVIHLGGTATRFAAVVGLDDEKKGEGSVIFELWADDRRIYRSPVMRGGAPPAQVSADLSGAQELTLLVDSAGDGISCDHADWAGAVLYLKPGASRRPVAATVPVEAPPVIASGHSPIPAIHGPRVVGATPGRPFLFLVPATGEGPLTYSATNLPAGLSLDPKTGIISGRLKYAGTRVATLRVTGPRGSGSRSLTIVGGRHKLALTPPMGWNSWNVWAGAVDAEKVREAADYLVSSGLAAHGYQYLNIDDTWEGMRGTDGEITSNAKFPDMKALADYVHAKGLKLGIYSSPGPKTCAGFTGSFGHEEQDARTWAGWGIDYLKYDWCSCQSDDPREPYRIMGRALEGCGRDIVYSLCQYGNAEVWKWGPAVNGNLWRTTGDINDSWGSMSTIGFGQAGHERYAGPGHWNDPDMMVVGNLGWGVNPRPTRLTPHEQLTHVTLWSLLAAPLLLGCDLATLDKWTLDLLTNDEVIAVNQDPLGRQAGRRWAQAGLEVWSRPLWDGTTAVGLFNRNFRAARVTARWCDLGLKGRLPVRDLWQQRDLGEFADSFAARIPAHGAMLLKIGRPRQG